MCLCEMACLESWVSDLTAVSIRDKPIAGMSFNHGAIAFSSETAGDSLPPKKGSFTLIFFSQVPYQVGVCESVKQERMADHGRLR